MNLLFRADASVQIGTGHVMRCLALAQALQDAGGQALFAVAQTTPSLETRLASEGCQQCLISAECGVADAEQTIALAQKHQCSWIVVDGYQFDADYQNALKRAGFKVLFLDDYGHAARYSADLLLNQNAYANEEMYAARETHVRRLLGPRYCLLRREFNSWRGWRRKIAPVGEHILVTMGGSDPDNFTAAVCDALGQLANIRVTVVAGGSNPHFESLRELVSRRSSFVLLKSAENMPELMAQADVAVAGAGTTCWEMCLLQLPMLLVDLVDNQEPIAKVLHERGAAIHLGTAQLEAGNRVTKNEIAKRVVNLLASQTERAGLSQRSGELVDGRGTERVLQEMTRG
jgi:UDP-2,4-diacetamido-2,4,6-trideoxy-beta-L-altropyranose hydrolase